ncbi:MAG: hypothetical protein LH615_14885 [Ferruginibacter sp.]|nr:hypothetical protein [Ferruginibacter sp.]
MNSPLHNPAFYKRIEKIYNAHAANMFGCIYKIVQDKPKAEKILCIIFQDFYNDHSNDILTKTEPIWFIKYAMKRTFNYSKQDAVNNELSPSILERIAALKKDITTTVFATA